MVVCGTTSKHEWFSIWHSAVNCMQCKRTEDTHPHSADIPDQPLTVDFMNRFPDTFQTVADGCLFGWGVAVQGTREVRGMKRSTRWLTNSDCIAQLFSTPTHSLGMYQTIMKTMHQQLQSDWCVAVATEQPPHRPSLPKLENLAVDADGETQVEWEVEDDVQGGPLNPHDVKLPFKGITVFVGQGGVRVCHRSSGTGTNGRNPVGLKWIDICKSSAEAPRYRVRRCASKRTSRSSQQHRLGSSASSALCRVSGRHFSC